MDELIEELKALGFDDEKATKAAALFQEKNGGLISKRDELLGELKKTKDKIRNGENTGADMKKMYELEDELNSLKGGLDQTKAELERERKKANRDREELSTKLSLREQALKNKALDSTLMEALNSVKVAPAFLSAAKALLKERANITEENGDFVVTAKGEKGPVPFLDFAKSWAVSDEGKHFILAQSNTGGGAAGGGSGSGSSKTLPREQFNALTPSEQRLFIKDGGKPV